MKTRYGFVSNSSSASFTIKLADITGEQLDQILNYQDVAREIGDYQDPTGDVCKDEGCFGWIDGFWNVQKEGDFVVANTIMDNFDFWSFLQEIGVDMAKVNYHNDQVKMGQQHAEQKTERTKGRAAE